MRNDPFDSEKTVEKDNTPQKLHCYECSNDEFLFTNIEKDISQYYSNGSADVITQTYERTLSCTKCKAATTGLVCPCCTACCLYFFIPGMYSENKCCAGANADR